MADLTTGNINTEAQTAASVNDGDYIYIYKADAGVFSKIEKSLLLQGVSGGSGSGISAEVYDAIKGNVNALRIWCNNLRTALANYAFNGDNPAAITEFTWPENESGGGGGSDTPTETPTLEVSPASLTLNSTVGTEVTKTFIVRGSNLTGAISLNVTGVFTLSGTNVTGGTGGAYSIALSAANGENTITVHYVPTSAGISRGSVVVSSTGASTKTLTLQGSATGAVDTGFDVNIDTYDLLHCYVSFASTSVPSSGTATIIIAPDNGYTLSGVTVIASATYGIVQQQSYDSVNDQITISVTGITHDTTIILEATAISTQPAPESYITDGLKLHLDGKNKGSDNTYWEDSVVLSDGSKRRFVYHGSPVVTDDGVKFTYVPDPDDDPQPENWQYAHYSDSTPSWSADSCTVEICFTPHKNFSDETTSLAFLGNRKEKGVAVSFFGGFGFAAIKDTASDERKFKRALLENEAIASGNPVTLSMNVNLYMLNGEPNTSTLLGTRQGILSEITPKVGLTIGGMPRAEFEPTFIGCNATIHEVRIYNYKLTAEQMRNNQRYDNIRYNLGLDI